jgi:hypothetical protein
MINFSDNESQADVINLEDDKPNIIFGPHFEGAKDTIAPLYITLTVHDHLLHNCTLYSGASHIVYPKLLWIDLVSKSLDHMDICILLIQDSLNVWV